MQGLIACLQLGHPFGWPFLSCLVSWLPTALFTLRTNSLPRTKRASRRFPGCSGLLLRLIVKARHQGRSGICSIAPCASQLLFDSLLLSVGTRTAKPSLLLRIGLLGFRQLGKYTGFGLLRMCGFSDAPQRQ